MFLRIIMIPDSMLAITGKLQIETSRNIGELKNLDTLLNQDFRKSRGRASRQSEIKLTSRALYALLRDLRAISEASPGAGTQDAMHA
jgi:hypothetical protein